VPTVPVVVCGIHSGTVQVSFRRSSLTDPPIPASLANFCLGGLYFVYTVQSRARWRNVFSTFLIYDTPTIEPFMIVLFRQGGLRLNSPLSTNRPTLAFSPWI